MFQRIKTRKRLQQNSEKFSAAENLKFWLGCGFGAIVIAVGLTIAVTDILLRVTYDFSGLEAWQVMDLRRQYPIWQYAFIQSAPLVTGLVITALCLFIHFLGKTKLGQDFRSVGQNQHIAEISGINVDRTRIIATIFSTVLAAWGMIIFLQNMDTLMVYESHRNIGFFSVAALLVGGASTSKASVKNALLGAALFNSMTIVSPEWGFLFNSPDAGEFFRSTMVYGSIGLALALHVWKTNKAAREQLALK